MKRRTLLQAAPALLSLPAWSQAGFPNKPIRYIVPVSAGGGSDFIGRTVTERWSQALKQTIVVKPERRRRHDMILVYASAGLVHVTP